MGMVKGTPFVGLPGNPAAVYVTFLFVVRPLLAHLGGAKAERVMPLRVRSTFNAKKKPGRREFVRVTISRAADGVLEAHKFPKEGAALLTSLTTSDGLAELADGVTSVAAGDIIRLLFPRRVLETAPHSAATGFAKGETRAAQNLNSGIKPTGSSAGLVRRLAAASA